MSSPKTVTLSHVRTALLGMRDRVDLSALDARYCANACRQSAYRRRRAPRVWHRRAGGSRLPHVDRPTVSLTEASVRPVPLRDARRIIERQEPMCGVATLAYGLFLGDLLASITIFGVHPASNARLQADHRAAARRHAALELPPPEGAPFRPDCVRRFCRFRFAAPSRPAAR
jgi:hypothetical protein